MLKNNIGYTLLRSYVTGKILLPRAEICLIYPRNGNITVFGTSVAGNEYCCMFRRRNIGNSKRYKWRVLSCENVSAGRCDINVFHAWIYSVYI